MKAGTYWSSNSFYNSSILLSFVVEVVDEVVDEAKVTKSFDFVFSIDWSGLNELAFWRSLFYYIEAAPNV